MTRSAPPSGLLFAITALGVSPVVLIAPAIPALADDLLLGGGAAPLVLSAVTLPGIVGAPLAAAALGRHGMRRSLVVSLLLFAAGGIAAGLLSSIAPLLAARVLQGAGAYALLALTLAWIAGGYDEPERSRALGRNAGVMSVTILALPLLGGQLAGIGWRWAFAPFVLAVPLAAVVAHSARGEAPHVPSDPEDRPPLRLLLATRPIAVLAALAAAFFLLLYGAVFTLVPVIGKASLEVGPGTIGLLLAVPAAASLPAVLKAGTLAQYPRSVLVSLAFAALGVALVAMAAATSALAMGAALLVWGVGQGAMLPALQGFAGTVTPAPYEQVGISMWVAFAAAAQTIAPAAVGGLHTVAGTSAILLGGAGLAVACCVATALFGPAAGLSKPTTATG